MKDISDQTLREIIDLTTEKVLLKIPEVIGSLITHHVSMNKANKDFYKEHPEFQDHKKTVASVIEQIEGDNPSIKYERLLEKSVPVIKERIDTISKLDIETVPIPSMNFNGDL